MTFKKLSSGFLPMRGPDKLNWYIRKTKRSEDSLKTHWIKHYLTAWLIIHYNSAGGRNWRRWIYRANVTNRHIRKPSKSLVRTLRRFSFIVSARYQHHRIPDGLPNVRRKMSPKVYNTPVPEVWTHNNLSRHLCLDSIRYSSLFILLCSIVHFMLSWFNW